MDGLQNDAGSPLYVFNFPRRPGCGLKVCGSTISNDTAFFAGERAEMLAWDSSDGTAHSLRGCFQRRSWTRERTSSVALNWVIWS